MKQNSALNIKIKESKYCLCKLCVSTERIKNISNSDFLLLFLHGRNTMAYCLVGEAIFEGPLSLWLYKNGMKNLIQDTQIIAKSHSAI